ncbi:cysteine desulfurase [Patescibacteria group bacterium]|nr:cysteine desulfurase [Patescibacteria group bacterium]
MEKNKKIYLDYAATTPIDSKVLKEMLPYLEKEHGNPSSIYEFGQRAQMALDKARGNVGDFLNCSPSEIIFTGSATEANNLAIFGIVRATQKKGMKPHLITTEIEHHAVLEPCKILEKEGVEVSYLPVNKEGLIRISDLKKAITRNTILVSVMYANNEIGTIQPIAEIGKLLKKSKILFHTDAVQAANYLSCDVKKLGVDLLTLSGHKIYGPKGVGALYVKKGTEILPIIYGGGQETGVRSGTENVAGIVGLAAAIKQIKNEKLKVKSLKKLRDKLIDGILKSVSDVKLNGSRESRLPNNANFTIRGAEGESMVIALDQEGIAASTGSACSSRSLEPSHVLLALRLPPPEAHSSLRLTLGRYTTEKEIDKVLEVLPKIVQRLRKISPFK